MGLSKMSRTSRWLVALTVALAGISMPPAAGTTAGENATVSFGYAGAPQVFQVPGGVTEVTIEAWGASGEGQGGLGGYSKGTFEVLPAAILTVYVGGSGTSGGWNGGGVGGTTGGGGSDVRWGATPAAATGLWDRKIVAGGGGGSGTGMESYGGYGGGEEGGGGGGSRRTRSRDGQIVEESLVNDGGAPGTQTTGAAFGQGGDSTTTNPDYVPGGGGGGGWYGGYAGALSYWHYSCTIICELSTKSAAGGGGGSGYVAAEAADVSMSYGVNAGDGRIDITYVIPESDLPTAQELIDQVDVPEVPDDLLPGADGTACSDETWHVDTVSADPAAFHMEVVVHDTPTAVEVCTEITAPSGEVVFDEDIVVSKLDPTDLIPPLEPPSIDEDAPDGEAADSPCAGGAPGGAGTANTGRAYARTGTDSRGDTVACVGFRGPGAERHVWVTVH